jgi:hypothetical protein
VNGLLILAVVPAGAAGVGVALAALEHRRPKPFTPRPTPGWVYFAAPVVHDADGPPPLVKIGMTRRDPARYRLPELGQISPVELELIHLIETDDPAGLEASLHNMFKEYQHHGEWYDRDAVMSYLDYAEGVA